MRYDRAASILIFLLVPILARTQSTTPADVAVYFDEGAWEDGVIAFESFLDWKGLSHQRVDARWINANGVYPQFKVVYFPGGYAYDYKRKLTAAGERHLREHVAAGGGYVGICAGAFYAATRVDWEGGSYPYTLGLFKGRAYGALSQIKAWPDYTLTTISLNPRHDANAGLPAHFTTLYFGGPAFYPDPDENVDTLATWDQFNEHPAIIALQYGQGRVLLVGPHPEIEENSRRDGNQFASELSDPETEWGMLWQYMDWVLQRPITDTTMTTGVRTDGSRKNQSSGSLAFYPNPSSDALYLDTEGSSPVEIEISDLFGRNRMALTNESASRLIVSVKNLPAGLYVARITMHGDIRLQLLRIQR